MNARNEINVEAAALACLSVVVAQLKEEGAAKAGEYEGLFSYGVLNRLKSQAQALGVPLDEIGLGGFNPDTLLHKSRKAA